MRTLFSLALGVGATLIQIPTQAQTLFTYGSHPVSKEEFLRVYQKNNTQKKADFSKTALTEYIDLYSKFKMKVSEAEQMKLDTITTLKNELNGYKNQLARNYLTDKEVNKNLANEAYSRMKNDIKASHILIAVRPNEDTAKAYQKIDSIYKAIISNKATFEGMARQFSEDKGSAVNGGNIGYFTALQMVYPFESAAYNTPVGQVSKPFKTQFGYHIVKVTDKRNNRGEVKVAQIMINTPKSKGQEGIDAGQKKIAEIQQKLKSGEKFETLVKEYSDDNYSKNKDGVLDAFGVGKYAADFEDAAFALNKPGEISAPLVTEYGIHLLKLISKTPLQPFDSIKEMVTRRVENDSRASVAKEVYQEKIKKEYGYKTYDDNFQKLMAALPATINKENPLTTEKYSHMQSPLFELKGQKYTQSQFINYVVNITRGNIMGNKENTFRDLLKMYENSIMSETQQTELENKNAEYRALVNEYKDGMLLFELTDRNVWSKASKDTVGLAQYFENNRQKYTWKPGFEGTVYQSASEVDLNRLKSDLDKGGDANEAWKALNESEHPIKASQQSGHFENFKFATDLSQLKENSTSSVFRNTDGTYTLVRALKTFSSPTNKTYEEAKGFVVADYQDYLEQNWIKGLKAKYPVKVEEKVLKTMIK